MPRGKRVIDWLKALLSDNLEMRQHEYVSQTSIQRWSGISRSDSVLFEHLLTFENAPLDPSIRGDKDVLDIDLVQLRVHTNYPLTFVVIPDDTLTLRITYDVDRLERSSAERLAVCLERALGEIARKSDRPLCEIDLISASERDVLLNQWCRTDHDYGNPLDLVDRFESQALRMPDAVAACCEGAASSYGELKGAPTGSRMFWRRKASGRM